MTHFDVTASSCGKQMSKIKSIKLKEPQSGHILEFRILFYFKFIDTP